MDLVKAEPLWAASWNHWEGRSKAEQQEADAEAAGSGWWEAAVRSK